MPRTPRSNLTTAQMSGRRRSSRSPESIVDQITRLVAANQTLRSEGASLRADNEHLRAELSQIGDALGRVTGGRHSGRGAKTSVQAPTAPPRRTRKPITNPAVLEKRRQALTRARAVRAERIAAARAVVGTTPIGTDQPTAQTP
jgi:hypothetical protein